MSNRASAFIVLQGINLDIISLGTICEPRKHVLILFWVNYSNRISFHSFLNLRQKQIIEVGIEDQVSGARLASSDYYVKEK